MIIAVSLVSLYSPRSYTWKLFQKPSWSNDLATLSSCWSFTFYSTLNLVSKTFTCFVLGMPSVSNDLPLPEVILYDVIAMTFSHSNNLIPFLQTITLFDHPYVYAVLFDPNAHYSPFHNNLFTLWTFVHYLSRNTNITNKYMTKTFFLCNPVSTFPFQSNDILILIN